MTREELIDYTKWLFENGFYRSSENENTPNIVDRYLSERGEGEEFVSEDEDDEENEWCTTCKFRNRLPFFPPCRSCTDDNMKWQPK